MSSPIEVLRAMCSAAGIRTGEADAEALVGKFESMTYLLQCDSYAMSTYTGASEKTLHLIRLAAELTSRRITDRFRPGKKYSEEELAQLAVGLTIGCTVENAYCILLDGAGKLITVEWLGEGIVNSVGITPRKLLDCIYKHRAKSIIVIHNHPCGIPAPSADDIKATIAFKSAVDATGVKLLAHFVVSGFNIANAMLCYGLLLNDDEPIAVMRVGVPIPSGG